MSIVSRAWNRIYTICLVPLREKVYSCGRIRLKYVLFKQKSDVLVIGFQACHKDGARYNYVNTLKGFRVNRLYIKDDFAENHRGNYYLGCDGRYDVETAVFELINEQILKTGAKKLVFIGSSKGAYAAINFGIAYPNSVMIVASPQYYLGDYLNCDYQLPNLKDILGDNICKEKIDGLNQRLHNRIMHDVYGKTQRVFIHYSQNDHTYDEHIKDLLFDLRTIEVGIRTDVKDYSVHGELKYYYPDYLRKSLKEVINS